MRKLVKTIFVASMLLFSGDAFAQHHHGHEGFRFFFGSPFFYAPYPYYVPPVYVPPPYYASPSPAPVQGYCQQVPTPIMINGVSSTIYTTYCLQPDGLWHIVQ